MDFDRICRICLEITNDMYNITHKSQALPETYSQMLRDCTRLQISDNDNLPKHICSGCIKSLEISFNFNLLCDKSNKLLLSHIEDPDPYGRSNNENHCSLIAEQTNNTYAHICDDIKDEPTDIFDSHHWDNDDDIVLHNIKQYNKTPSDASEAEEKKLIINERNDKKKVKRKRGRPKKNEPNDVFEPHNWDNDDNVALHNIKQNNETQSDASEEEEKKLIINESDDKKKVKVKVKRKRGRPKNEDVKLHQCDICGKVLSSSSNLNVHRRIHDGVRPYKCEFCPASYRGHSSLSKHMLKHTGIVSNITCDVCSKHFSCTNSLKTHMLIHTGVKKFKCEVCLKLFTQKCQLLTHSKRHTKEMSFLCVVCGKGFAVQSQLKVHERVHTGEKPYTCNLCPKTFATHGNLAVHLRIHRKEIRYTCNICQRGFVTCNSYSLHMKRHKGIKNYICECGKAFYTQSLLKQHKIVHTRDRMYQCTLCLKEFIQSSHCNRHYKKAHLKPGMVYPPPKPFRVVIYKKTRPTNLTNEVALQEHVLQENGGA